MIFGQFKKKGILGINRRIGEYILPYNPRNHYPLVDSKVHSFELARAAQLPTPEHYAIIERFGDLRKLHKTLTGLETFAVKPANGSKGNGILIVESMKWNEDFTNAKVLATRQREMDLSDFRHYLSGILSGLYSLNGLPDQVLIQEKLIVHPYFEDVCFKGIPDIRVIIFQGFPVMAMIRLPTEQSGGRANLHQGAVGCGIDIRSGQINNAVFLNRTVHQHPDTGIHLGGRLIPHWEDLLLLASRCFEVVGMGYLGVDLVLDEKKGPLILEMNARPGLAIQVANLAGLEPRLKAISSAPKNLSPEERVKYSQERFGVS